MSTSRETTEPISVMKQNVREKVFGGGISFWEAPIQVCDNAGRNGGNVVAIVHLGGPAGTGMHRDAVVEFAERICACVNACIGLEPAAIPRLIEDAKNLVDQVDDLHRDPADREAIVNLKESIVKVTREIRQQYECGSCFGYGHFDEDGEPTENRNGRKCLDCRGTGVV